MTDATTAITYIVQHQQVEGGDWYDMKIDEELHVARAWERTYRSMPNMVGTVRTVECRTTDGIIVCEPLPPA